MSTIWDSSVRGSFVAVKPDDPLQEHPAFGPLSYREYGALMAKHTEHHFRQFGL